jgi:hypothetical protein
MFSTVPVKMGGYVTMSNNSMTTAYTSGYIALYLQAKSADGSIETVA